MPLLSYSHRFSQKQKSTPFRGQRCLRSILSACFVLVLVAVGVAIPKGTAQAFDVPTAVYDDVSFNLGGITYPTGLDFNPDGTKMFVVSYTSDSVSEYTLSTGFDVSTASFVDSFSVAGQDSQPSGVVFNTDGTKMFVTGLQGKDVNEYTLSTGFDVSTASFVDSFSVAGQVYSPQGVAFNPDGTKMFVVGSGNANEYTLSTGFDVSTASFVDSFSVGQQPTDIAFSTDGTTMLVLRYLGNSIYKYTLSTGFDVSTASFFGETFYVNAQSPSTWGLAFSTNGTKMYVAGDLTDSVFQYSVTPPGGANVPEFSTWALLALLLGVGWHLQQENHLSLS